MIVVRGLAPNAAYLRLLSLAIQRDWPVLASRTGACRDLGAVTVELDAGERTILLLGRGWNPVFAIVESAWIIAGRNDLKTLTEFIPRFDHYSDDGQTLNGAYGHRLRNHFGRDQLEACVVELSRQPQSRRVVLSLYAASDLGSDSKDIPCNTQVAFRRVEGRLEMTVSNRSNDLWLGVPYNWFAFHILQHQVARRLQIPCGVQRHVSSCLHLYDANMAAAQEVVRLNREADLARLEADLAPLDVQGLLDDAAALADQSFNNLSSMQLVDVFQRYRRYRGAVATRHEMPNTSDVLATALDRWFSAHHSEVNAMPPTPSHVNGETETHLRILRWISSTEPSAAVEQLSSVAERSVPTLREALQRELGPGVTVGFDSAASQQRASLHFQLELILGTLDPELVRTHMGDRLRKQVAGIAEAAGFPIQDTRPREAGEEVLVDLFGDLLVAYESS